MVKLQIKKRKYIVEIRSVLLYEVEALSEDKVFEDELPAPFKVITTGIKIIPKRTTIL